MDKGIEESNICTAQIYAQTNMVYTRNLGVIKDSSLYGCMIYFNSSD